MLKKRFLSSRDRLKILRKNLDNSFMGLQAAMLTYIMLPSNTETLECNSASYTAIVERTVQDPAAAEDVTLEDRYHLLTNSQLSNAVQLFPYLTPQIRSRQFFSDSTEVRVLALLTILTTPISLTATMLSTEFIDISMTHAGWSMAAAAITAGTALVFVRSHPRSSPVITSWDDDVYGAIIRDDAHTLRKYLVAMAPTTAQANGWSLLHSAFEACLGSLADEPITTLLRQWLQALSDSGVNLSCYGREEARLYKKSQSKLRQRFVGCHGRQRYRVRLAGIIYGPLPNHWSLLWIDEDDGVARDFWDLVERQGGSLGPPSIQRQSDLSQPRDEVEENDDPWELAEKDEDKPLVWTEYRRKRQPFATGTSERRKPEDPSRILTGMPSHGDERITPLSGQSGQLQVDNLKSSEPSNSNLRRKAKNFMKFWKRRR
ncbi:hypothetical protein CkaCkLH20_05599 [Colletotrichum karsti]|uniref:Uncharacterized protein n=1 Tax=Colletotrichum karsti TaxID=1095194 RepID=A0A9P6I5G5_9PEZI|nr:uncharacterized protein CkaCkLH20_05599 [Colletotrichum karsti]KAF9876753.1 hypothetical protein CkaCkLH20_05599 [Colletotrichum karsti]